MRAAQIIIFALFALLLATPMFVRARFERAAGTAHAPAAPPDLSASAPRQTLMIVTPHVEQIRSEFAIAFDRWHRRVYSSPVAIDWRTPGGTTEIVRLLQAQYTAAAARILREVARTAEPQLRDPAFSLDALFTPDTVPIDLMFGGGSFDHGRLKDSNNVVVFAPLSATPQSATLTLSLPRTAPELSRLDSLDSLLADVTVERATKPFKARVPVSAVQGGIAALAPLKTQPSVTVVCDLARVERRFPVPMSAPAGFSKAQLDEWFGPNKIGSEKLYDPDQFWLGTALSGFGIVFNRDLLAERAIPLPDSFAKLGDPRYVGMLALADPRQSGSVATAYDSVLNKEGWDKGWRILREISANARAFSSSSTQPPIDVSQGDALAGVAIDFYGRGQAQALQRPGGPPESSRLAYIDPPGAVYIDADPISILRGGRSPDLARHFVEFILSEEGQALWQFPARADPASAANPRRPGAGANDERMGPVVSRLRRMPVRRVMYERYVDHFADQTNPFDLASDTTVKGWRTGLIIMMGAFGVDAGDELRAAWLALNRARANPSFPPDRLAEMERLFYSFPEHQVVEKDSSITRLPFSAENYKRISDDTNRWRDPVKGTRARIAATQFFRDTFQRVVDLERQHSPLATR